MFEIEFTLINTDIKAIVTSIKGEDIDTLKSNYKEVIKNALREQGAPNGYFDVEILITENGEYFDSESELCVYFDGDVKVAPVVGLRIYGKSNLSNLAIDYVEVELSDGTLTAFDWEVSYWDDDEGNGSFRVELPNIATTNEIFINGDILKNIKCVNGIQVYSDTKIESPEFSIDKIEILEDCVSVEEITNPEIKEIIYEF